MAASIPAVYRKEMWFGGRRKRYFTAMARIPDLKRKVRVVILWHHPRDETCRKILVTNRIIWEVSRIVRVYVRRWAGKETFRRDGNQQLRLGNSPLLEVHGRILHLHLVLTAYGLLMGELKPGRAIVWATERLMSTCDPVEHGKRGPESDALVLALLRLS